MAAQSVLALVHEANGAYGISFPDFPGAVSGGGSLDEAVTRGQSTLAFHIEGMIEDGEELPRIRSFSELRIDPAFREAAADAALVFVPLDLPGKAVRVNVSIDENLLERIDRAAAAANQSRSAFLADAARARIRESA
jgi:predicted RNase H-like HicB family nuclease